MTTQAAAETLAEAERIKAAWEPRCQFIPHDWWTEHTFQHAPARDTSPEAIVVRLLGLVEEARGALERLTGSDVAVVSVGSLAVAISENERVKEALHEDYSAADGSPCHPQCPCARAAVSLFAALTQHQPAVVGQELGR